MEQEQFADDTELFALINASGRLWHGKIVQAIPERFETTQDITSDGTSTVALPTGHYKTLGVRYVENGESYPLDRVQYQERWRYKEDGTATHAVAYYLKSTNLHLLPAPASGKSYKHDYVPGWTDLDDDADTVDGFAGWEQWIVYDVVIKLLGKEESHASMDRWRAERDRIDAEMMAMAQDREAANPMRVVDVRCTEDHLRDSDFWMYR